MQLPSNVCIQISKMLTTLFTDFYRAVSKCLMMFSMASFFANITARMKIICVHCTYYVYCIYSWILEKGSVDIGSAVCYTIYTIHLSLLSIYLSAHKQLRRHHPNLFRGSCPLFSDTPPPLSPLNSFINISFKPELRLGVAQRCTIQKNGFTKNILQSMLNIL